MIPRLSHCNRVESASECAVGTWRWIYNFESTHARANHVLLQRSYREILKLPTAIRPIMFLTMAIFSMTFEFDKNHIWQLILRTVFRNFVPKWVIFAGHFTFHVRSGNEILYNVSLSHVFRPRKLCTRRCWWLKHIASKWYLTTSLLACLFNPGYFCCVRILLRNVMMHVMTFARCFIFCFLFMLISGQK